MKHETEISSPILSADSPIRHFADAPVQCPLGLRLIPTDWTSPLDLAVAFGRRPQRLEVDLGCGKGRFLLARAAAHPQISFLGLDRQRQRLAKVERKAERSGLANIRVLYSEAAYAVTHLLPANSVAAYYLFFPDPWPKRRHHRRRLFACPGPAGNTVFIAALAATMLPRGCIHLATDHLDYFTSIQRLFRSDPRFVETEPFVPAPEERTDFELIFLQQQKPIGRCSFAKS
ncbi:MAG: tRNA (guanine(46)-N(7))-methyltransferase TrmB [Lentisphaerae bacterium]|nr:tRNA (guanine(46)-N(7))-methyltransferase TrmB [Lentisphaerota bacterium]